MGFPFAMSAGQTAMKLYCDAIAHAVMLFYGVDHLLAMQALLNARHIVERQGRLWLALQPEEMLSKALNLSKGFTRKLLCALARDRLAVCRKLRSARSDEASGSTSPIETSQRAVIAWGVDFHAAVDAIEYRLHHMKVKVAQMNASSATVLYCPVCNATFSESGMDKVLFEPSGDAFCPSMRSACDGQKLEEKQNDGPSREVVEYAKDVFDKQTRRLRALLDDVRGLTPPLYAWPLEGRATTERQVPQITTDAERLEVRDVRANVPWFSDAPNVGSNTLDEEEPVQEDIGDIDGVMAFFNGGCNERAMQPLVSELSTAPTNSAQEDSDAASDLEEPTVTVKGVPKLLSEVTEEDQRCMTDEEYHRLWQLCKD